MSEKKVYRLIYVDTDEAAITRLKQIIRTYGINSDLLIDVASFSQLSDIDQHIQTQGCDLLLLKHAEGLPSVKEVSALVDVTNVSIFSIVNKGELEAGQFLLEEGADFVTTLATPNALYKYVVYSLHTRKVRLDFRETKRELVQLREQSEQFLSKTKNAIAYSTDGLFVYANEAFLDLFGIENAEKLSGILLLDLFSPNYLSEFKKVNRKVSRSEKPVEQKGEFKNLKTGALFSHDYIARMVNYEGEMRLEISIPVLDEDQPAPATTAQNGTAGGVRVPTKLDFIKSIKNDLGSGNWLLCVTMTDYLRIWGQKGVEAFESYFQGVMSNIKGQFHDLNMVRYSAGALLMVINDCDITTIDRIGNTISNTVRSHVLEFNGEEIQSESDYTYTSLAIQEDQIFDALRTIERNSRLIPAELIDQTGEVVEIESTEDLEGDNLGVFSVLGDALKENRVKVAFSPISGFSGEAKDRYLAEYEIYDANGNILSWNKAHLYGLSNPAGGELDLLILNTALARIAEPGNEEKEVFCLLTARIVDEKEMANRVFSAIEGKSIVVGINKDLLTTNREKALTFLRDMKARGIKGVLYGGDNEDFVDEILEGLNFVDYVTLASNFVSRLSRLTDRRMKEKIVSLFSDIENRNVMLMAEGVDNPSAMAMVWEYAIPLASGRMLGQPSDSLDFDFDQMVI